VRRAVGSYEAMSCWWGRVNQGVYDRHLLCLCIIIIIINRIGHPIIQNVQGCLKLARIGLALALVKTVQSE
jgi:hypothetical protein